MDILLSTDCIVACANCSKQFSNQKTVQNINQLLYLFSSVETLPKFMFPQN